MSGGVLREVRPQELRLRSLWRSVIIRCRALDKRVNGNDEALASDDDGLCGTGARGGGAGGGDPQSEQDIFVTGPWPVTQGSGGTKTETPLIETPQSITVISRTASWVRCS